MVAFKSFSCSRSYCAPSAASNAAAASRTAAASSAAADMTYGKSRGSWSARSTRVVIQSPKVSTNASRTGAHESSASLPK